MEISFKMTRGRHLGLVLVVRRNSLNDRARDEARPPSHLDLDLPGRRGDPSLAYILPLQILSQVCLM